MPVFRARRTVKVPADIAYAVAADVESYREFLPLVEQSSVIGTIEERNGTKTFRANLQAGYRKLGLHEQFVSEVTCDISARRVTATSSERPFRHMRTIWSVTEIGPHAQISIEIEYAMRNPLIQGALSSLMDMAVNRIVTAFEERAKAVYDAASKSM